MIARLLQNVLMLGVAAGIVGSLTAGALIAKSQIDLRGVEARYGASAEGQAEMTAFQPDGTAISSRAGHEPLAVRYASSNCPYCKQDSEWNHLGAFLEQSGVRVVVILPTVDGKYPEADIRPVGAIQAAFVSAEWLERFPLSMTPTLLIFDGNQALVWHRRGVLTSSDSADVRRLVDAMAR